MRSGQRRGVFRGAENLGVQARALKLRSALFSVQSALLNLGARSQKLGAHSALYTPALYPSALRADIERVRTRCIHGACERRGEIQALPLAGSALSKV